MRKLWFLILLLAVLTGFNGVQRKTLHIVFIGDSITYGAAVEDKSHQAPPAVAADELRKMALIKDVQFYNAGKSGATTLDFLPGTGNFAKVTEMADKYYNTQKSVSKAGQLTDILLFSVMLGTNDSAIEGPNGAPVDPARYRHNLQLIIDSLLTRYPSARVVINKAPWYSDNTYNGAKYLKEGRTRLEGYNPKIEALIKHYKQAGQRRVFLGDQSAYGYFERHFKKMMAGENGRQGVFYLHPNKEGSAVLGKKWAKVLYKTALQDAL